MAAQLDIVFHDRPGADAPALPAAPPEAGDVARHVKGLAEKMLAEMTAGLRPPAPRTVAGPGDTALAGKPADPAPAGGLPFAEPAGQPYGEAWKRLQKKEKDAQVKAAMAELAPPPPQPAPPPFDPIAEARKQFEKEDRRKAVAEARQELRPPAPFDAFAEARKLLDKEDRQKQVLEAKKELEGGPGVLGTLAALGKKAVVPAAIAAAAVAAPAAAANAFVGRGQEIQQFSGDLVGANVQAELRQMQTDMREAQALGPELAGLTTAQSELFGTVSEALIPIKEVVIDVLADAATGLKGFIEFAKPAIEGIGEVIRFVWETLKGILATIVDLAAKVVELLGMEDIAKSLREMAQNSKKEREADHFIDLQLANLDRIMQMPGQAIPPDGINADNGLGVPAFQKDRR